MSKKICKVCGKKKEAGIDIQYSENPEEEGFYCVECELPKRKADKNDTIRRSKKFTKTKD